MSLPISFEPIYSAIALAFTELNFFKHQKPIDFFKLSSVIFKKLSKSSYECL